MANSRQSVKRRTFLKTGLAGAAGLCAAPAVLGSSAWRAQAAAKKDRKFIHRTLGKTGIKLPIVSMGVMNADNPNLVQAALDSGIIHLDTAHSYQRGRNEEMIGQVIKGRPRDSFVIATKVNPPGRDLSGAFTADTSPEKFLERFNLSLQRLGLDYVEILYLHNITRRSDALFEPILKALETAKKQGKAKFVGLSTHANEPESIRAAIESKLYDAVLTSYNFKQNHYLEVRKAVAEAAAAGLGIVAMKTAAGGYWDKEKKQPINAKAALKWTLSDTNVHTAIPGMTTFDHLETDLSVMEDLTMTEQEKADLKLGEQKAGLYCQQCGACTAGCPKALPIPDLMRSYMYAYGYRNIGLAQELVSSLGVPLNPCSDCVACSARCAEGFDVRDRITDIARLSAVPADFFA